MRNFGEKFLYLILLSSDPRVKFKFFPWLSVVSRVIFQAGLDRELPKLFLFQVLIFSLTLMT